VTRPAVARPALLGIVNVTPDSFSDGGRYLDAERAVEHAHALWDAGADFVDIGAASSHPAAPDVPPEREIARLAPVLDLLEGSELRLSIDSARSEVQGYALARGVSMLNDIRGFADPAFYPELARHSCKLVLMYSAPPRPPGARSVTGSELLERIRKFFEQRTQALIAAGIAPERIIVDPGMGLFLGPSKQASLTVLRALASLRDQLGYPMLIGISRKSILTAITDGKGNARPPLERAAAGLAAELFAARSGVDYIRTHDVRALRDGLAVERALSDTRSLPFRGHAPPAGEELA